MAYANKKKAQELRDFAEKSFGSKVAGYDPHKGTNNIKKRHQSESHKLAPNYDAFKVSDTGGPGDRENKAKSDLIKTTTALKQPHVITKIANSPYQA